MKVKYTVGEQVFHAFVVVVTLLLSLAVIIPLLSIVFASFSDPVEVMKHTGLYWHPIKSTIFNYQMVFKNPNILTGYLNTIFVVLVGTSLNLALTIIAAYVLSRKGPRLIKIFTVLVVFTMYFQGGTIPSYLIVNKLGLVGHRAALILPGAVNTFNLVVLRTAMAGVPESLPESAMIDGAGHGRILTAIMVPVTKASIAVITLYYAVSHWNSWFPAMIYLKKKEMYPLQYILRMILIQDDTQVMTSGTRDALALSSDAVKYATIVVATVPILAVYPFLQKYFVKGVMVGAVKG
ncbi:MAG: carbohydrate ABC transporter permease [Sphaerochaetaceae bacterium]|nr:carbohydrate ABC transporter permease [Sphaerochaetaceae bacterium]